jgi:hypothetical protein
MHKESMSTQELFVEHFARLLDHYQHALTSDLTDDAEKPAVTWNSVSMEERNRMVAAARLAIMEIETNAQLEARHRKYFAKPGEAEWGC